MSTFPDLFYHSPNMRDLLYKYLLLLFTVATEPNNSKVDNLNRIGSARLILYVKYITSTYFALLLSL